MVLYEEGAEPPSPSTMLWEHGLVKKMRTTPATRRRSAFLILSEHLK